MFGVPLVLVIDDSLTSARMIQQALPSCQCTGLTRGTEAAAQALKLRPALILLKDPMPDTPALEICAALGTTEGTRDIPIVVLASRGMEYVEGLAARWQKYPQVRTVLTRPFTNERLEECVDGILREKLATAEPEEELHLTTEQTAEAAQVLFRALREGLNQIPRLVRDLGMQPPAPVLANNLFTPDVVEPLALELYRLVQDAVPKAKPARRTVVLIGLDGPTRDVLMRELPRRWGVETVAFSTLIEVGLNGVEPAAFVAGFRALSTPAELTARAGQWRATGVSAQIAIVGDDDLLDHTEDWRRAGADQVLIQPFPLCALDPLF